MSIEVVEDVVAPLVVTAFDVGTAEFASTANEWTDYGMTAVGYLGGYFMRGRTGDFLANVGACSLPLSVRKVYARFKGTSVTRQPDGLQLQPIKRQARIATNRPQFADARTY